MCLPNMKLQLSLCFFPFLVSITSIANSSDFLDLPGLELEVLTVTGDSYELSESVYGTRSIILLDDEVIKRSGAYSIENMLMDESGILPVTAEGGMATGLNIRGYRLSAGNIRLNDHPDNLYLYRRDLSTVGSVEVIKGMSSVIYGMGAPGGSVAYRTKKPQWESYSQGQFSMGSNNLKRLGIETTGAITKQVASRVLYTEQRSYTFMDNVADDRRLALGSLQWDYTDGGHLLLELEHTRLSNPYSFGIVRAQNEILYDISYADPRNESDRTYQRSSLYWEQVVNRSWTLNMLANYVAAERDDLMMGFYYKIDEESLAGYWADVQNQISQFNSRIAITGTFTTVNTNHQLTLGADFNQLTNAQQRLVSSAFTLDIFEPEFGSPEPRDQAIQRPRKNTDTDKSLFIANSVGLGQNLTANAGLRYTEFRTINRLNDNVAVDESAVSSELGARWAISERFSTWLSSSRSFEPNYGTDTNGDYFDPKEAVQYEIGANTATKFGQFQVAAYQLQQRNLLTPDPNDKDALVATGTRQTLGVEFGALVPVTSQWEAKLNYTHMHNEITDDVYGLKGNRAANVPYYTTSITLDWVSNRIRSTGLTGYVTVVRVGERFGDARNTFRLEPYHTVNAGLTYEHRKATWQLVISNLTDKRYVSAATAEDDIYQGDRRSLMTQLSLHW